MPPELIEDALGDPRNAGWLAHAADLAYFPQEEGAAKFRDELGMEARLFSVGNTQAYVLTNADHIVVAFRGTEAPTTIEGLKDWLLTDAANLLIVPEGRLGTDLAAAGVGAKFHQGFVTAIADIWDPVFEAVDAERKKQDRPIWLTGHSLGGALALLAAWLFRRKFIPIHQIYTFGGPMIGNRDAIQAIDKEYTGKIFRYVNSPDPVPQLPTMSLLANHYGHCEKEMLLGAIAAASATSSTAADFFKQLAAKAVEGKLDPAMIDGIWEQLKQRVDAHAMTNYRSLVASLLSKS
ncbi:MAG: lipase family protein [Gemmataceae bacterium]|nr:lipase family protein [Gemmataceae bacterium]